MIIMGVSGKAGTGKDFISNQYLKPRGFRPWSLAWHFKIWLVGKGEATYDEVFHTKPPHVRKLLQEEGTERGRLVYGEDVWCNTAATWIRHLHETWGVQAIVIPDVRFPNEVAMIQRLGGKVLRISAPKRAASSALTPEQRAHQSETALDDFGGFDGFLYNDVGEEAQVEAQLHERFAQWGWVPEHGQVQRAVPA